MEVVDPSERISGSAAVGLAFVQSSDAIGTDRLWAYLSPPVAQKLKLKISSIDGRYYAEVDYVTGPVPQAGWVALDLTLRSFSFVEKSYASPMNEVAVLLGDADTLARVPRALGRAARGRGQATRGAAGLRLDPRVHEHRARPGVSRRGRKPRVLPRRIRRFRLQVQCDLRRHARRAATEPMRHRVNAS